MLFNIQINVDKRTAHTFNSGQAKLYDILLLHLHGGKDIFITVSRKLSFVSTYQLINIQVEGTYIRSCFGGSINGLVQLTVPIAELSPGQVVSLENGEIDKL